MLLLVNFLAHHYLAGPEIDYRLGAIMGDFVKGRLEGRFPSPLADAIQLHRQVDSHSDRHPRNLLSRSRFSPSLRRYAGIVLDLCHDHFLIRNWGRFDSMLLADYTLTAYQQLESRLPGLSPELQQRFGTMISNDFLWRSTTLDELEYALERIARRLRKLPAPARVRAEIEACYPQLEADFLVYFPQVIGFAEDWRRARARNE